MKYLILLLIFLPLSLEAAATPATLTWSALPWQGWVAIAILALALISLVAELLPPDIILLLAAGLFIMTGVLPPSGFTQIFGHGILWILAMLFIIARALETNGVLNLIAEKLFPKSGSYRCRLLILMVTVSLASAFLNNTPIILMMVPIVRKWARDNNFFLSKFLIPIAFAAHLGGTSTLIGHQTNLVVNGLLRAVNPEASLGFFEMALVGVPCLVVGLFYLWTLGSRLVPVRQDPSATLQADVREWVSEFVVRAECGLAGKTIHQAAGRYLHGDLPIQIERGATMTVQPSPSEVIHVGDRLIFVGEIDKIAGLHAIEGLSPTADPHFQLDMTSSHFSEVVIAASSGLVGKTLRKVNFRTQYGASVIAIYRQGHRVAGTVSDVVLRPGDTLILLGSDPAAKERYYSGDFFVIRHVEELPMFRPRQAFLSMAILVAMVVAASLGVGMIWATSGAALLLLLLGCISWRRISSAIQWNLLLLIGCAFILGYALLYTGVATLFAKGVIAAFGSKPVHLVGGIFLITMIVTEVITSSAAALIVFPIALEAATLAGYAGPVSIQAIGITVAVAAACCFLTPTGYQTNTIVYGPGGYRFTDYARVGFPLSILMWLTATLVIPCVWPLT